MNTDKNQGFQVQAAKMAQAANYREVIFRSFTPGPPATNAGYRKRWRFFP
jgi:hypothetical protein